MNEARKKQDKPDDPAYPGGEDETSEGNNAKSTLHQTRSPWMKAMTVPPPHPRTQERAAAPVDIIGGARLSEQHCLF
jgi:hypothetical protein